MAAIQALGKSRAPEATELLFQEAMTKAKEGTGFPGLEMRALLDQAIPEADLKYDELRQELLSGKLGWTATTREFWELDFFRKQQRE